MILGLRTVVYYVADLDTARKWYSMVLEQEPYFDTPFYVGYSVGGFELGLHPNEKKPVGPGGHQAYWGVADLEAEVSRLAGLGVFPTAPVSDVGEGIKHVEFEDPFGNLFGLLENPHFRRDEVR